MDSVHVGSKPVGLVDTVMLITPMSRGQQSTLSVISTDSTYSAFLRVTFHQGFDS